MKKILSLALAVLMLFSVLSFAGCNKEPEKTGSDNEVQEENGSEQKASDKKSDETGKTESDQLVMYTNAEFPPFEYMVGDKVAGVDVDIAQAIADKLGKKLSIQNVKFDTIIGSIKSGKGDIGAAGITVTDERKEEVDFSISYTTSKQYIILKKDSDVETIEDLAGKKIGVQLGTTGDIIISGECEVDEETKEEGVLYGKNSSVQRYNNAIEASMALTSGKIDAVVIDKLPAENIAKTGKDLKAIELVYADGSNTEESYAIAVKKGNEKLLDTINEVIQTLIDQGKINEFIIKHSNAAAAE